MHYCHLIAVVADDEAEAITAAESALESYGDGDVWDWYEIGGRWAESLDGKNALRYTDNPTAFTDALEAMKRSRNAEILNVTSKLSGKQIGADEVVDTLGLGIPDPAGAAVRISADNAAFRGRFEKLLAATDPLTATEDREFGLLGHYLYKLGKLIAGYYTTESFFFDGDMQDPSFEFIGPRIEKDPSRQWLVVCDLHN